MTLAQTTSFGPTADPMALDLASYRARLTGGHDELIDAGGQIRPHWRAFLGQLAALTPEERRARAQRLDTRVRETGIAHNIFADPSKEVQRWHLDLAPVIISGTEWRQVSAALVQRARLFDAVLADLYGPQRLMRDGLVPPELVFSDNTYLRPCQLVPQGAGQLHFYAADLARGDDGQWRVIDNHTETLAGLGFAIANRVVHSHIAGDIFKRCNVVRLADHFQHMQGWLKAHSGRDSARIALLTPGPHHADYFSHAYAARYLGLSLVEGRDLVTKGARVYLKTLEGLQDIDLIVRCVDGRLVDPLELDPGGFGGPAGLMRVCRRMPGFVVNAIGSGIVENRGLGRCLPAIAQALLGEDLAVADAPRRWLGDAGDRDEVLRHLDQFVIRKAHEGTGRPGQAALGVDPSTIAAADRDLLVREIELNGRTLVAEEKIGFSTAPGSSGEDIVPRPFAMRCFVARTGGAEYRAMPGGLAMTVNPDRAVALSAPDGHTRDVWIVSDAEQSPHVSLWRTAVESARVARPTQVIQSRVADDLFWLGRYAERSDWTMRVMRSVLRRTVEDSGPVDGRLAARRCVELLLGATAPDGSRPRVSLSTLDSDAWVADLISGDSSDRTLERTCAGLHRVAYLTRDRLSLEAWQTLAKFGASDRWFKALATAEPGMLLDLLDEGLTALSAFNGLSHENMTRNVGWAFLDMGRRLERAYNLSEAILALFVPRGGEEEEASQLLLLLELADSFITYRSRYRLDPVLPLVLDLLLLDEGNPRSLAFQLAAFSRHMDTLPDAKSRRALTEDRRILLAASTSIRLAQIETLASPQGDALAQLMREQLRLLPELSSAITGHYFNLVDEAPQRAQTRNPQRS